MTDLSSSAPHPAAARAFDLVLFDFGGVFTASPFAATESFARQFGFDARHLTEILFGPYHLDTDHPWHRMERGELSLDDARSAIAALARESGLTVDPFDVFRHMSRGPIVREEMVQVLREVKAAGYATAIVTNNIREFRDGWRALLPLAETIDAVFDSCELGIRKPNPEIFRHVLRAMGEVPPARAVFLDDAPQNVASARALGIRAIVVDGDGSGAIAEVREMLGLGPGGAAGEGAVTDR